MMAQPMTPLQEALLDAYAAACDQVPVDLRREVITIGGAASIAHGLLRRLTKDVDILASTAALVFLKDAADNRRGGFRRDTDETFWWDNCDAEKNLLFSVEVELLDLGGPIVPLVPDVVSFRNGFVATLPELVRLRASSLSNRGDDPDYVDFPLVLAATYVGGLKLAHIDEKELDLLVWAVEEYPQPNGDVMLIDILGTFEKHGYFWRCWKDWGCITLQAEAEYSQLSIS